MKRWVSEVVEKWEVMESNRNHYDDNDNVDGDDKDFDEDEDAVVCSGWQT